MTAFYDLPKPENSALKRSQSLSKCIQQEINNQGGQISFATFMELSLYHPLFGYYNADTFDLGKRGDFTTAAEISPLYAKCFARQAVSIFSQLGPCNILEIGAGTGRFAHDILLELNQLGCKLSHYYIYEISENLRIKQQDFLSMACPHFFPRLVWLDTLPEQFTGIIIVNEVLDALPVHCFRIEENQIKEKCVSWDHDRFVWTISAPKTQEFAVKVHQLRELYSLQNGYESEINLRLSSFVHALANTLSKGILLFADYGYGQQEYYHPERQQGTLTCFYQHNRHHDPLILPGSQDITAHVDFTRVAEEAVANQCSLLGFTSQATFLLACGLMDIAADKEKGLSQVDEFYLHQSIKLLTLPSEMGERVKIMALGKHLGTEIESPLLGFRSQDRRRDL